MLSSHYHALTTVSFYQHAARARGFLRGMEPRGITWPVGQRSHQPGATTQYLSRTLPETVTRLNQELKPPGKFMMMRHI